MEKRRLGRSDVELSVMTMGCWQAGKAEWQGIEDADTIAAMRAAFAAGITSFDTAEAYGGGYSEQIVAKALGDHRDEIVIATKVGAGNLAGEKVRQACERSLQNLNTDRIDLYQIHWPSGSWGSPLVPIEDTMHALLELQQAGKIRAIGVSNFNGTQIEAALQHGRIDSLQPPYSLFFRPFEANGTFDTCVREDIGILAYSPLAQGLLTGKFNADNRPTDDNRRGNALFQDPIYTQALQAVDELRTIAQKYGVTTGQLSLQWLLKQPGVTSVIVGARNAQQITDNVPAATLKLDEADLEIVDRIGRGVAQALPADKTNMWA